MGDGKLKSKNYYWLGNLSQQNACWNRTHYVVSHENNILQAYTLFSSEDDVAFSLNLFLSACCLCTSVGVSLSTDCVISFRVSGSSLSLCVELASLLTSQALYPPPPTPLQHLHYPLRLRPLAPPPPPPPPPRAPHALPVYFSSPPPPTFCCLLHSEA